MLRHVIMFEIHFTSSIEGFYWTVNENKCSQIDDWLHGLSHFEQYFTKTIDLGVLFIDFSWFSDFFRHR